MLRKTRLESFIWGYLSNKKLYVAILFLAGVIWSLEIAIKPYLIKWIINSIVDQNINSLSNYTLLLPIGIYIALSMVLNLVFRLHDYAGLKLYPELKRKIVKDMYSHLMRCPYAFFKESSSGSLCKKIFDLSHNTELLIRLINETFFPIFCTIAFSCFTLLIFVHYIFTIILIVWTSLFTVLSIILARKLTIYSKNLSAKNAIASGEISDAIANITSIKVFSSYGYQVEYMLSKLDEIYEADWLLRHKNLKIAFFQGFGITVFILSTLISLMFCRLNSWLSAGDFAFVMTLSMLIINQIHNITQKIYSYVLIKGICENALTILSESKEIEDLPNSRDLLVKDGRINLNNVSFSYDKKNQLFHKLNLTIKSNEKIAIVGKSGVGKSTLIKLIMRLYPLDSGCILLDNYDISEFTLASLMSNITVINQDPDILNRDVIENIKWAKPNSSYSEVIAAIEQADCQEFISKLPNGYNTILGEKGIKLSGGQKQRIAIARAFLRDAKILILDETTSALDSITERKVQRNLDKLMKNKTCIVITHKISTLKKMDRIVILRNGIVVKSRGLSYLQNEL